MASTPVLRAVAEADLTGACGLCYHSNVRENTARRLRVLEDEGPLCNVPCFKGDLVARLRRKLPGDEILGRVAGLFAVLGDRHRLRILWALRDGEELCVCDVAHVLGVRVSLASHHLRKLRDMGILKDRDDGRMVYYALRDRPVGELVSRAVGLRAS